MTKYLYPLSLLLFLNILAQPLCAKQKHIPDQDGIYVEIPYELVRGKIIIKLNVEGVEGRYIYDTGATTIITHARFIECGDKKVDEIKITDANGYPGTLKQVFLETVKIKDISLENIRALVINKGNPIECFDVDGLIGNNVFANYVVRIDSKRKVLTISDKIKPFNINPEYSLPITPNRQNQTIIEIKLNNLAIEPIMFDTGSAAFYELNERTFTQVKNKGIMETLDTAQGATGVGVTGKGNAALKYKVKVPKLSIGKGMFENVTTITMRGPASRIGTKILEYGIVTIDYPNNTFYFEPYDSAPVDTYSKDWNVAIITAKDHLEVGLVWGKMQDILKGGEKIVEINGRRIDKIDFCNAIINPITSSIEGDKATITIIDSTGTERKIEILKE